MIRVTRFDGSEFIVNADLIEFIESKPDTVISLTTGKKLVVRETPAEIIELVIAYRQRIAASPQVTTATGGDT